MCRRFDTIPACDGRTDRRTDGIAVANTALAIPALRRAVKTGLEKNVACLVDWPRSKKQKRQRHLAKSGSQAYNQKSTKGLQSLTEMLCPHPQRHFINAGRHPINTCHHLLMATA